jgi:type I restriction enzyme S subunit
MRAELPQGWAVASLAELTAVPKRDIISGPFGSNLKSDEYVAEGVPIVRLQNVDRNRFLEKNMRFITEQKARELSAHNFRAGDVVITKLGDPLGKACAIPESLPHGIVVADVVRVRIDEARFSRNYALFAINSPAVANQINSEMMGSTRPRVNLSNIRDLQIPLAPLAEQRRIVAKLEKLFGQVDACQQRLEKMPALLKRFRQSILAAACSGRLTADWREEMSDTESANALLERIAAQFGKKLQKCDANELPFDIPSSWGSIQASDLCRPGKIITYGILKPVWVKDGVPTVRVQDMKRGKIVVDAVAQCCPERAKKFSKTTLEVGDLLIAKDGATLGKTAFVPPELGGGNITQHVLRFPISLLVESVFVRLIIDSRHGQEWMRTETRGAALPGVNVGDFRRMPIPLPPLAEQQEIVRRVEALFALADQLELRLAQARGQVAKLAPSLLARAFAGKLVPQNPADEPAEKLLERIRVRKI